MAPGNDDILETDWNTQQRPGLQAATGCEFTVSSIGLGEQVFRIPAQEGVDLILHFADLLEKGQDDLPRGDFASGEPGLEFGQGEMLEHDAGSDYSTIFGTTNNPLARAGALRRASS